MSEIDNQSLQFALQAQAMKEEWTAVLAASVLATIDELIDDCEDGTSRYYRSALLVARDRLVRTIDHFIEPLAAP